MGLKFILKTGNVLASVADDPRHKEELWKLTFSASFIFLFLLPPPIIIPTTTTSAHPALSSGLHRSPLERSLILELCTKTMQKITIPSIQHNNNYEMGRDLSTFSSSILFSNHYPHHRGSRKVN